MKLSIVIVNYKTAGLVMDCLRSIVSFAQEGIEIIVVDNDSGDDISSLLTVEFPAVIFIQAGYNAGFARANNMGIRKATGEMVLLLNSDTIITSDAIQQCARRLGSSDYAAAGVQLLNEDGSPQVSGNFVMTGGLNYLLPLPVSGVFFKWLAQLFGVKKTNVPEATSAVEVDWINGAFLMVKMKAIEVAGLLDEDFFLYFEEAEWCSRLRKAGKIVLYGDLNVVHLQGASANEAFGSAGKGYYNLTDKKGFQIMLSCFLRLKKEFGIGWMLFLLVAYIVNIPVYFIAIMPRLFTGKFSGAYHHWKGYTKNVWKLCGYIRRIVSGEPYFYKVL